MQKATQVPHQWLRQPRHLRRHTRGSMLSRPLRPVRMDPHLYPAAFMATQLHLSLKVMPRAPQMNTTKLLQHRQRDSTQGQMLPHQDHFRATSSSSLAHLPATGILLLNNNSSNHRLACSLEMEGLVPQIADKDPKNVARRCARSTRLSPQGVTVARTATVASAV